MRASLPPFFVAFTMLLLCSGLGRAALIQWTGTGGESWNTPGLWNGGAVPTSADDVWFNTDNTSCTIASGDAVTLLGLIVGRRAVDAELVIDGGSLTTTANVVFVGQYDPAVAKLVVKNGGSMSSFSEISIGVSTKAELEVDGGSLVAGSTFSIGRYADPLAIGSVVMTSGSIDCGDFNMNAFSSFDFQGGTLVVDQDRVSRIQTLIANGQIFCSVPQPEMIFMVDYDSTTPGKTTLRRAIARPTVYVSPDGSAAGDGSIGAPLASLTQARDLFVA